jgi:hypothetical protein
VTHAILLVGAGPDLCSSTVAPNTNHAAAAAAADADADAF